MNQLTNEFLNWHAANKMRLGEFTEAATIYTYLHGQHADDFKTQLALAYCWIRLERYTQAEAVLEQIALDPNAPEQSYLVARLRRRLDHILSQENA